jgi:diaminohydroxyphosphoribosylaminopyrimidine deaminase/5-amino-6-(5-phosphoribosylamino)uracil reductase
MDLKLPSSLKIFNNKQRTVIFNKARHGVDGGIQYYKLAEDTSLARHIIEALYHMKIHSVLVEGGAKLLQSFIDEAMWDEIRVIKNTGLVVSNGLAAPVFIKQNLKEEFDLAGDRIQVYYKN